MDLAAAIRPPLRMAWQGLGTEEQVDFLSGMGNLAVAEDKARWGVFDAYGIEAKIFIQDVGEQQANSSFGQAAFCLLEPFPGFAKTIVVHRLFAP